MLAILPIYKLYQAIIQILLHTSYRKKKYLNILAFCKSTPEILSSQSFFHGKILSEIHPKGIITTTEALGQSKPRGFVQLLRVMKMHIKEGKEDSMAMVKNISSNASWMEQKRNGLKWTDMVCYLQMRIEQCIGQSFTVSVGCMQRRSQTRFTTCHLKLGLGRLQDTQVFFPTLRTASCICDI